MGSIDTSSHREEVDILIIGGGLSGCYALHTLRKLNPEPSIKLVEAGSDFGGVWHWNRYPGARVDSEWPAYQFSIPEVWKDWSYEDRFPDHNQLRAYVQHMDRVLDLKRDAVFNTIIDKVTWDDDKSMWNTQAQDGKLFTSRYLIICSGSSYKRYLPDFKGLQKFKGSLLHSATFSDEGIDVTGKRVGIIGAGASGVQLVQELAKQDCQLVNFIRTPNNAVPMRQKRLSREEQEKRKEEFADIFAYLKTTGAGFPGKPNTVAFQEATDEQRDAILQKAWDEGGFAFLNGTFMEYFFDPECNKYMYNFWAQRVRERITNPAKRDIMAPLPQVNSFSSKRPSLEQDYYESIDRSNVEVVSVKNNPIREITETGIVLDDETHHPLDILILATGFDALNGSQLALGLHDRNGIPLHEKWSTGTQTYLGLMIPGVPNAFMSYGPQAPTALGNAPVFIETAVDWIFEAMQKMQDDGIATLEPTIEAASQWRREVNETGDATILKTEDSWWVGANVPGKVREQLNYVAGLNNYKIAIQEALDGWKGFDVVMKK